VSQRRVYNPRARWLRRIRHKRNSISQAQREALVRRWMERNRNDAVYGSAFDFAVDCVHDLHLVCAGSIGIGGWPGDWEIPQYAVDVAESIMGSDSEEVQT
jgi:hypothetical protein